MPEKKRLRFMEKTNDGYYNSAALIAPDGTLSVSRERRMFWNLRKKRNYFKYGGSQCLSNQPWQGGDGGDFLAGQCSGLRCRVSASALKGNIPRGWALSSYGMMYQGGIQWLMIRAAVEGRGGDGFMPIRNPKSITVQKLSKKRMVQIFKYLEFLFRVIREYRKADIFHCNDLDTLPIGVVIRMFFNRNARVFYDAHEYETERNYLKGFEKSLSKGSESFWLVLKRRGIFYPMA
jgi:hypothetical protein